MKLSVKFLSLIFVFCITTLLISCGGTSPELLDEAPLFTESSELGTGSKTITFTYKNGDDVVHFTIHTDKELLGDALTEHGLIEGELGPYGLYVKRVNGMTADTDINGAYWGLFQNGELMMSGVDKTPIADGDEFEAVFTRFN